MAHVYIDSAAAGTGTGADWANAYTTAVTALGAKVAGDNFWVASGHAETAGAAKALTSPGTSASPCTLISVNKAGSVPPVSADILSGASIAVTGAFNITAAGVLYCWGVNFTLGTAANQARFVTSVNAIWTIKNSSIILNNTNSNSHIQVGESTSTSIHWDNVVCTFGDVGQGLRAFGGRFKWQSTTAAILGSVPTTLFNATSAAMDIKLEGVDLSAMTTQTIFAASTLASRQNVTNCKIGAGVVITGVSTGVHGPETYVINSDSAGTNYRHEKHTYAGSQVVDTVLIRTGGASNGTTGIATKITATANAEWVNPFAAIKIAKWNDTTAANVTVTIEGLQDPRTSVSLPTNADVWIELSYMGSAATPIATINSGTKADYLAAGANLTASTEAWDSLATARANTTVYALGDRIKVASNSGRVFICTTAGTSSGSEPAGYASAVDGGAVTDNTATFTAAVRFKQSITLSSPQPALKGPIYAQIKVGKASGIYYVDPKLVLS